MKTLFVVAALVGLSGCAAKTAYNADRTKSWTCVEQTRVVTFPGEPLTVAESKTDTAVVQK